MSHVRPRPPSGILCQLSNNPAFFSAALPRRIYPPLFNRYGGEANSFGNQVDNAIRTHPASAQLVRTDMSFTLFINNPDDYDGGETDAAVGSPAATTT